MRQESLQTVEKTVLHRIGDTDVVVSGSIENGEFITSTRLTKKMKQAGFSVNCRWFPRKDSSGSVLIMDDLRIYVVPSGSINTIYKNIPEGHAPIAFAIFQDRNESICGDTRNGDKLIFVKDEVRHEVVVKWNEQSPVLRYGFSKVE